MGNTEFRQNLYRRHVIDLQDVDPFTQGQFICPVCLDSFPIEAIETDGLTDGHVWPAYIRERSRSDTAVTQRVLLCARCNSMAGTRGDRQMQLWEQMQDAEEQGELYGERTIRLIDDAFQEPVTLRGNIWIDPEDPTMGKLTFAMNGETGNWLRNNPEAQERFFELFDGGKTPDLVIDPNPHYRAHLHRVGWVTSAYLLAFYALGYRYIFQEAPTTIREYISESFEEDSKDELAFPDSDDLRVYRFQQAFWEEPSIGLAIPVDGKTPVHLQISFLDWQVRLPVEFHVEVLIDIVLALMPDLPQRIQELQDSDATLFIPIQCNKHDSHRCIWDYILGRPLDAN